MELRSDELGPRDAEALAELYRSYEWWDDRTAEDVRRALEATDLAVGLFDSDDLVAAGRVLTDGVYYAKVYDVIVAETYRGRGVGAEVMAAIRSRGALSDVDVVTLDCREGLVPFYESCGFERHPMTVGSGEHEGESLVPMVLEGEE